MRTECQQKSISPLFPVPEVDMVANVWCIITIFQYILFKFSGNVRLYGDRLHGVQVRVSRYWDTVSLFSLASSFCWFSLKVRKRTWNKRGFLLVASFSFLASSFLGCRSSFSFFLCCRSSFSFFLRCPSSFLFFLRCRSSFSYLLYNML